MSDTILERIAQALEAILAELRRFNDACDRNEKEARGE